MMQSLNAALTRFVEQQDLYNEAYGLFQNHDLRPRALAVQPEVDKRISLLRNSSTSIVTTRW